VAAVEVACKYLESDFRALLDLGCDVSVHGCRILPGLAYQEELRVFLAVNSTPILILGTAEVAFQMARVALKHNFLVSDAIEEISLGSDWLKGQICVRNFDKSLLQIGFVCCSTAHQQLRSLEPGSDVVAVYCRT
jgi:hypothetical protein